MPMPQSWSKKKREAMRDTPHQVKPDADNLLKAFLDTLLPENDAHVWDIHVRKLWSEKGMIVVYKEDAS